jgi:hypothetical protein
LNFRYKACKESAETIYARLATLSALQSYGFYLPSLMAAAAAASSNQLPLQQQQHNHLIRVPDTHSGIDLSLKPDNYPLNSKETFTR